MYCTICSREKLKDEGPLRAIQRYSSKRILNIYEKSFLDGEKFVILSGKFGLLTPDELIPWYDQKLEFQDIPEMVKTLRRQMNQLGIENLIFFAKDRDKFTDWEPYYQVIEKACSLEDVGLDIRNI